MAGPSGPEQLPRPPLWQGWVCEPPTRARQWVTFHLATPKHPSPGDLRAHVSSSQVVLRLPAGFNWSRGRQDPKRVTSLLKDRLLHSDKYRLLLNPAKSSRWIHGASANVIFCPVMGTGRGAVCKPSGQGRAAASRSRAPVPLPEGPAAPRLCRLRAPGIERAARDGYHIISINGIEIIIERME